MSLVRPQPREPTFSVGYFSTAAFGRSRIPFQGTLTTAMRMRRFESAIPCCLALGLALQYACTGSQAVASARAGGDGLGASTTTCAGCHTARALAVNTSGARRLELLAGRCGRRARSVSAVLPRLHRTPRSLAANAISTGVCAIPAPRGAGGGTPRTSPRRSIQPAAAICAGSHRDLA